MRCQAEQPIARFMPYRHSNHAHHTPGAFLCEVQPTCPEVNPYLHFATKQLLKGR
jgi:hypothetical protein